MDFKLANGSTRRRITRDGSACLSVSLAACSCMISHADVIHFRAFINRVSGVPARVNREGARGGVWRRTDAAAGSRTRCEFEVKLLISKKARVNGTRPRAGRNGMKKPSGRGRAFPRASRRARVPLPFCFSRLGLLRRGESGNELNIARGPLCMLAKFSCRMPKRPEA